ncbi:hypothetical protein AcdelDRAFT_2103, partial [Acidovorax delafieldii 2AN]
MQPFKPATVNPTGMPRRRALSALLGAALSLGLA